MLCDLPKVIAGLRVTSRFRLPMPFPASHPKGREGEAAGAYVPTLTRPGSQLATFILGLEGRGWGEILRDKTLSASYLIGSNASLPSPRVRVLETGLGLHKPEALSPVLPEEQ